MVGKENVDDQMAVGDAGSCGGSLVLLSALTEDTLRSALVSDKKLI